MDRERDARSAYADEAALRRELVPGERLLWSARPRGPGIGLFRSWLFAIPWTAFALFWTGAAWLFTRGASDFLFGTLFPLFGIPFVLVGLAMLARPFFLIGRSGRTLYAITDRRLIRYQAGRRTRIEAMTYAAIDAVDAEERRDGSGTLFVTVARDASPTGTSRFEMEGVPDVARARRLLAGHMRAPERDQKSI